MSETQYITFRAIDSAVSKKNLAYMRRQSTRAEIAPRSFINEYTFGDFYGNAMEMLRRGYDIHVHYANYGLRSLYFRLPQGLPDSKAAKPYLDGESIRFVKDREGRGGTLAIEPCYEPGDLEELWEFEELIDNLVPLRSEITEGDLRPLYLAHLAVSCDCNHDPEETVEAPVPGGLNQLTKPQRALASLYELRDALIAAAGQEFGPLPSKGERPAEYIQWISQQPEANKNAWLTALMNGSKSKLRAEIRSQFNQDHPRQAWPTVKLDRTIAELRFAADQIQAVLDEKEAADAAQKRSRRLAKMAGDPARYLQKSEELAALRTTNAYEKVGQLLADLREALADTARAELAERQAQKLKKLNPTLRHLTAALRRQGFVPR